MNLTSNKNSPGGIAALLAISTLIALAFARQDVNGSPFLDAASAGKAEVVGKLILAKADLLERDDHGRTALHLAAKGGHRDTVLVLIDVRPPVEFPDGAVPPSQDKEGKPDAPPKNLFSSDYDPTPGASVPEIQKQGGFIPFDDWLAEHLKVLAAKDNVGKTPLHLAVAEGHFEVADTLTSRGAPPNIADKQGRTPLHLAALEDYGACVALLVSRKADPTLRDKAGKTALDLASGKGVKRRLEMAISDWASKPAEEPPLGQPGAGSLLDRPPPSPLAPTQVKNPLYELLERGPGATDSLGRNALHLVAGNGDVELTRELLEEEEAKPLLNQGDRKGLTPLLVALLNNHPETAALLIEAGANVQKSSSDGSTPLHAAAITGNPEVVTLLLHAGANPAAEDKDGNSPSTCAMDTKIGAMLDKAANDLSAKHQGALISLAKQVMLALQRGDATALTSLVTPEEARRISHPISPYRGKAVVEDIRIGPRTAEMQIVLTPPSSSGRTLQLLMELEFELSDRGWLVASQKLDTYP